MENKVLGLKMIGRQAYVKASESVAKVQGIKKSIEETKTAIAAGLTREKVPQQQTKKRGDKPRLPRLLVDVLKDLEASLPASIEDAKASLAELSVKAAGTIQGSQELLA